MDRETIKTGVAAVIDGLRQAALYIDDVPTIGLLVAAVVLTKVTGTDNNQRAPSWIIVSSLLVLLSYFAHQYLSNEPYGAGEFLVVGIRGITVFYLYRSLAGLVDFVLSDARAWRTEKYRTVGNWLASLNRWRMERREQRQEEKRRREVESNAPEPLSDEEAFECAMRKAQNEFSRQCQIINSNKHLDDYETESAISQARAMMTTRINKIMEGEY